MAKSKVRKRFKARKAKEDETRELSDQLGNLRRAFVELSEDYKWIEIRFPFTYQIYNLIRSIQGAHFRDANQGGPLWRVPRDLDNAAKLREIFGPTEWSEVNGKSVHMKGLWIGNALRSWARREQQLERNLGQLTNAKDAELTHITAESRIGRAIAGEPVPELELLDLPTGKPHPLMIHREPRPYQRADIKIMSMADVMNCNQPGTGKTIETIGSWVESDAIHKGPILVISPVKALENTWLKEILRWLGDYEDVAVYTDEATLLRRVQVESFLDSYESGSLGESTVLVLNYEWMRLVMTHKKGEPIKKSIERVSRRKLGTLKEQKTACKVMKIPYNDDEIVNLNRIAKRFEASFDDKGNIYAFANDLQRRLLQVQWGAVTIDEFHKSGLNNRRSLFYQGVTLIDAWLKSALSGTPMGGKPRKLWPVLHWLSPENFSSEWSWINKWLKTQAGHTQHSKIVGALQKNVEEKFAKAHSRHMIRRTKLSVLPGLPERIEEVRWSKMVEPQKEQYDKFAAELEIRIDEERLSANNVLSEYTRLKQFANAMQKVVEGVPYPTSKSGKLDDIEEILDENGIRKVDPEPGARAILGTESKRFADMVHAWLTAKHIPSAVLTGDTKDSESVIGRFKHGGTEQFVIVMTVQTGGVSLDLEEAQSMIAMDETWNPDDLEQFFERGDRSTRTTPLRCYILRTRGTIQEYIAEVNEGKAVTNATVLDVRRKMHDAEMI